MNKIIKKLSLSLAVLFSLIVMGAPITASAALFDDAKDQACQGLGAGGPTGACDPNAGNDLTGLIRTLLNLISVAVGVIAVIMVIVAGLKYITSQGDSNSINSAKNTLLYAIIGLVLALLAQLIVRFVLKKTI